MKVQGLALAFGVVGALAMTGSTSAAVTTYTFNLTDGTHTATATFVFDNGGATTTLDIMLSNTMTVNDNPSWLCGLFFDLAGSPTMTYTGLGGDGSDAYNDMVVMHDGGNGNTPDTYSSYNTVTVDHFWGLNQDISDGTLPFGTQSYGLGSAGFGVFPQSSILNFQAGGPTPQPDGSDGGILSGSMLDAGTLNIPNGHTERPMVDGGIWLTFDLGNYDIFRTSGGLPDLVSNVNVVFGTSFGEVVLVPAPLALPLGLAGLLGVVAVRRRYAKSLAS